MNSGSAYLYKEGVSSLFELLISVPEAYSDSEDALVDRAIQADQTAFAHLYDKHVSFIYRHVFYRVFNHADAEDITQEVFGKAWKAITRYRRTGAPFVSWLTTIAHNLIMDHHRSNKKDVPLEETRIIEEEPAGAEAAVSESDLNRSEVRNAVMKLKGDKQKVIIMHFIDGFSYQEISHALGKSEGAIRVIQYRALKDLKSILERESTV